MKILITGGAGFVGSNLAKYFRHEFPQSQITAFDNLKRRGSELNLKDFRDQKINFVHGDIRNRCDFDSLEGNFDLLIEASAEPSVLAGLGGSPHYLLDTNLGGTINCLEFARSRVERTIFLSTSRVYSIEALRSVPLVETESRLVLKGPFEHMGLTEQGITEDFDVLKARSLYGASKLASEFMCQEYHNAYGSRVLINRCGVIAGAGQFGKVDQGVFTLWVAHHVFGKSLSYTGFGGQGKQVRDLLHPHDLFQLILKQMEHTPAFQAEVFNVGGGLAGSVSLRELTGICQAVTGKDVAIGSNPQTNPVDIPFYISDNAKVEARFGWKAQRRPKDIVLDISNWINENKVALKGIFA